MMNKKDQTIIDFFPPSYWKGWYIKDLFEPKFSTDWNMLMRIVEGLEEEFKTNLSIEICDDQCSVQFNGQYDKTFVEETKIKAVYEAVVGFIMFCNKNKVKFASK